jgi:RNA polymerase sigma factor (TIGR02999 family)
MLVASLKDFVSESFEHIIGFSHIGTTERSRISMTESYPRDVTVLLQAWRHGEEGALDKLMTLIYGELRQIAHKFMVREHPGHTLQTTAIVNEAYLRLIDASQIEWKDRAHFFAVSANVMRRVLVDFARSRGRKKRGGDIRKVEIDEAILNLPNREADLVALDDALDALAEIDKRKAKVIELRFFGGLSMEETAAVLSVSPDTVRRDWRLARVWLCREMKGGACNNET